MSKRGDLILRPIGQMVDAISRYGQSLFQPPQNEIRGIKPESWFSPLQPTLPIAPPGTEPKGYQFWAGQNLWWTPRPDAEYSAADLKALAKYPLAAICIENVKDTVCRVPWEVQMRAKPGETRSDVALRAKGDQTLLLLNRFFEYPDREHDWQDWLRPLLDDLLVIDAPSILIRKNFRNELAELAVLRGEMISKLIDQNGYTPAPPSPAYYQNFWGIPLVLLTTDQLVYKPRNIAPRNTLASQLYGFCLCDQTEILTKTRGWLPFAKLRQDDEVATRHPKTLEREWQLPSAWIDTPYKGAMLRFTSSHVDQLVTPQHRMVTCKDGELRKVQAAMFAQQQDRSVPHVCGTDSTSVSVENYDGSVHCVTVPNGIIEVRRNGKISYTSNSPTEQLAPEITIGTKRLEFVSRYYCYSEDTEVLTRRGWLKFSDANQGDEFATRQIDTGIFEWQRATEHFHKHYDGEMVNFKGKSIDLLVTPNHRMLVDSMPRKLRRGKPYRQHEHVIAAEDLIGTTSGRTKIPVSSSWTGKEIGTVRFPGLTVHSKTVEMTGDQYCAFMGTYLAEGSLRKKVILIAQPKDVRGTHGLYEALLHDIFGGAYFSGRDFEIGRDGLALFLRQFGHANEKFIPPDIRETTPRQLEIFWKYYYAGDGRATGPVKCTQQAFSVSKKLADQLTEIVQKMGAASTVWFRPAKLHNIRIHGSNYLSFRRPGYLITRRNRSHVSLWKAKRVKYSGCVCCVVVPNKFLYVRRNGKACWSGNTEGSVPGVVQVVPRGTNPDRITEAMQWMNSELAGNLAARSQWRLIQGFNEPGKDDQILFTKEPLLAGLYDEKHIREICFGYGTSPSRLIRMIRTEGRSAGDASTIEGTLPWVTWLKGVIDYIIQRKMGYIEYEIAMNPYAEPDPLKNAAAITMYVKSGVMTPNEARKRVGEELRPEPEADRLGVVTGMGFVPIGIPSVQAGVQVDDSGRVKPHPVLPNPESPGAGGPTPQDHNAARASTPVSQEAGGGRSTGRNVGTPNGNESLDGQKILEDYELSKTIRGVVGHLKGESKLTVQTVIIPKDDWTLADAKNWVREHGFKVSKVDESKDSFRFRQKAQGDFDSGSFQTVSFGDGNGKLTKRSESRIDPSVLTPESHQATHQIEHVLRTVFLKQRDKALEETSRFFKSRRSESLSERVMRSGKMPALKSEELQKAFVAGVAPLRKAEEQADWTYKTIFLMRHGRTALDPVHRSDGWLDFPLSDDGRVRLITAQQYVSEVPLRAIYCASLKRTKETAEIVSSGSIYHPRIVEDDRAKTWNLGVLAGKKKAPNKEKVARLMKHPDEAPEGGESRDQFRTRLKEFMDAIKSEATASGGPLLTVFSGSCLRELSMEMFDGDDNVLDLDEGGMLSLTPDAEAPTGWTAKLLFGHKSLEEETLS